MTRWKGAHVPPSGLHTSERLAAGGGRSSSRSRVRACRASRERVADASPRFLATRRLASHRDCTHALSDLINTTYFV